jgi:hypothetical protein
MRITASQKFNAVISLIAGQDYSPKSALEIVENVAAIIPDDSVEAPTKKVLETLFLNIFKTLGVTKIQSTRLIYSLQNDKNISRPQAFLYIQTACDMNILEKSSVGKGFAYSLKDAFSRSTP